MSTIAERVARGAALLDEREPGWWQRINLGELDLGSSCRCVLGQLATDRDQPYTSMLNHLGLRKFWWDDGDGATDDAWGFNAAGRQSRQQYANLTAEWRRVIGARRAGTP